MGRLRVPGAGISLKSGSLGRAANVENPELAPGVRWVMAVERQVRTVWLAADVSGN